MFEIEDRGGLGRSGSWSFDGRALRTPAILFAERPGRPAPDYAEALLVKQRVDDARLQVRVRGSLFSPLPTLTAPELPPSKGLPLSVADLDRPTEVKSGAIALLTARADLERATDAEVVFLASGVEYDRHPREFVQMMALVRETLGPAKIVGITGIAAPSNLAVLIYAGIDIVDSSRMILDSARGLFHTSDGVFRFSEVDRAACACPACVAGEDLHAHNERVLFREQLIVRNHIAHGRLRELVERRLANDPWNTAVLRHLDLRHLELVEQYTPVTGGEVLAFSRESLTRPEVVRFRRRIRERYRKPPSARVLLLLPCSARKPYSMSRSHRRFRDAIRACGRPSIIHEVVVTSPLGLVPREVERFYPARAYDIPVTGDWNRDEASMVSEDLRAFVDSNRYDGIVAHLGPEAPIVKAAVPEAILPSSEPPTSDVALAALTRTLSDVVASYDRVPGSIRFAEEMANIARFQFGDPGRLLADGASFRGRFPEVRVTAHGEHVATYTERGMLSLTLAGGRLMSQANAYCVEIEDFLPKGNIFAIGVTDASRDVRVGDDVTVRCRADVRAVGTARMGWREMVDAERGEAVHVRHVVSANP